MPHIVANIISLRQHIFKMQNNPKGYLPPRCLHCCQRNLWFHGAYFRKSDRSATKKETFNPVPIQRFYCPSCRRTCSSLPEAIPPRRWYLWDVQQIVILLYFSGVSIRKIAQQALPSRQTVTRWINRFTQLFRKHKNVLSDHDPWLGRTVDIKNFWGACCQKMTLAQAMRVCHIAGIIIP